MKNKLKALLPLLFVIALLAVMSFAVNAEECEHTNIVYVEPTMGDCHLQGYKEHWYCSDCDGYWLDEDLTYQVSRHSVILFRPAGFEPDVQHIEAVEPTCVSEGNIEYWYCVDCDRYWTDEALTQLTNRKLVLIEPTGHNVVHVEEVEPGCHTPGHIEYWYCTICNEWGNTENLDRITGYEPWKPSLNLPVDHYEAKEPTCSELGNIEYWYCENCDQYWTDEALTRLTNRLSVRIGTLEHTEVYVAHKEPTCTENGNIEYWYCSECGTKRSHYGGYLEVKYVIPALGHNYVDGVCTVCGECEHNITHVEAVEPRCHFEGNLEYWYCTECDDHWLDEGLTYRTNRKLVILPQLDSYLTYVERISPTCTTPGNIEYWYCEECGLKIPDYDAYIPEIEYDIPALGHDYVNGICQRCGDVKETTAIAYGLEITVYKLEGVRDFLIAPGHHEVYSGIKQNYVLRVTEAKFSGKESYTAFVTAPGEYTVLVRYNDGSEQTYHYVTAEAVTPEFSVSGLSVSISNLEGLRTIRTAPGEWNTPGEVKRAAGARNIPARNISGDTYKLQYAENGVYTVSLEYTNGLVVVEHIELSRTEPTLVQDGNKVTLGNLDGLYVVRYAPGEFTSSYDIKRADGAKYVRPYGVDENGEIVIELDDKVYTICVQYNDGSCNFFTVNEEESLLEKYGLTVKADLFENKEPGALQDGASLTVTLESENASRIPQVTIKVKRQEGWFLLIQKNPQNLVFSTINNTYIEQITLEWILQGLDGEELDAKLDELYLNSDPLWDISRQYNDFDIVPLELSITIGDETEIITVYPVYEVVY